MSRTVLLGRPLGLTDRKRTACLTSEKTWPVTPNSRQNTSAVVSCIESCSNAIWAIASGCTFRFLKSLQAKILEVGGPAPLLR